MIQNKINFAILSTNYGRSAIRVLKLWEEKKLPDNVNIEVVVYQNLPSGAAEYADNLGIKTVRVNKEDFKTREAFEQKLLDVMTENKIDYIFLLAFSYLIKHDLLKQYADRIINIHPSLLPAFKGHKAIQQAMEYGVAYSGITTHFIDMHMDKGKIIAQLPIRFFKNDTFEDIDKRYMENSDQILLETFNEIVNG
ncbi:phosphoribosylglycinamide formyltransferase [Aequorivita sp. H23M31]|uniref:phosphoribosylglycinamide formyltransferase 1 n=1 Tax=Aequorivita ciconiae TaxID=2494375 RepID=A0A410G1Z6_9FLAO|nr:formyltransferase family protein [Aequorivita sp. H23M31]QAA81283.1 phosphoribosylglycinamide formyltransferase [Aequorivita sp. H23M31]